MQEVEQRREQLPSRSYVWREEACPGPPGTCQRRKSVA